MKTIQIHTSTPYHVFIGENILSQVGFHIKQLCKADKVAIISDTNVWPLYGEVVCESLRVEKFDTIHYIIPAGENSKTLENYADIVAFLAENHMTRSDVIIALGGGVVGDITGFVAATYLRGVAYIQVPTSLLAMVDSSVGGKTSVDLPNGKNLVGTFYQPLFVLCDIQVLQTLPDDCFRDGCAEIIKYGLLFDPDLFQHLLNNGINFDRQMIVARCIEWKANVVSADEFDLSIRQKLNLGHTIGHAIEVLSHFVITHGQAVATGMAIIIRSAYKHGYCTVATLNKVLAVLKLFALPITTSYTAAELYSVASLDKKRNGNRVNVVIPCEIGQCIVHSIPIEQLESFIEAGL